MKKKIKIKEVDYGMAAASPSSYPTSQPNKATTSGANTGASVNIPKKDLNDPKVQQGLGKMKGVNVNVVEEENVTKGNTPTKLSYLSEIMDENNEPSKPFNIKGKNYQMVRAITPDKQKVTGVYSLDELDEMGEGKIYDINEFEETIARKAIEEEGVVEPEGPEAATLYPEGWKELDGMFIGPNSPAVKAKTKEENLIAEPADEVNPQSKADEMGGPNFAGFKHYIVNRKTGKARKFKNISELAKANMSGDEEYMGIKDFKKFVDETLFGSTKKQNIGEDDAPQQVPPVPQAPPVLSANVEKLIDLIKTKIPSDVIPNIQQNPQAQEQVIIAFATEIGVPANRLNNIINGIRGLAKEVKPTTSAPTAQQAPVVQMQQPAAQQQVAERRIIKVKDIINE